MMKNIIVIQFGLLFFASRSLETDIVEIDVLPNHPIYELGEDVNVICCSADSVSSKEFEFYKKESKIHSTEQTTNCTNFEIKIKTKQDVGPFQCLYQSLQNGSFIQSNMSRPITILIAETPQPPSISLTPSYTVYAKEENLTLTCSPPTGTLAKGIQIYQEKKKIHEGGSLLNNYLISAATENASGKYACKYWVEMNGRNISSSQSDYVIVNVTETPRLPSIRLNPLFTVYTKQESLTLTCLPPTGISIKVIQFYHEEKKIHEVEPLHNEYMIFASNQDAPGKYACKYLVEMSGRNISSSQSDYVKVNVTDKPLAPSLVLSPTHPVYIRGEYIKIICSPPFGSTANSIDFYKDTQMISSQQNDAINISTADITESAKYSCRYAEEILGRSIYSTPSDEVTINTIDFPPAPSISLEPAFPVYTSGENVTIICATSHKEVEVFQYFKNGKKFSQNRKETFMATLKTAGSYSCLYKLMHSGREIDSQTSLQENINVIKVPPAPSINVQPLHPVYVRGETINITCSPPDGLEVAGIHFFKDGQQITPPDSSQIIFSHIISSSSQNNVGNYSCGFWVIHDGRQILSQRSLLVVVKIVEVPRAPSISLTPLHPVYVRGDTLNITCSPPNGLEVTGIQFFKDGQQITSPDTSHIISSFSQDNVGNYSCGFWTNPDGRWILSQKSLSVAVNIVEIPQAPSISLMPLHPVYIRGETINITCSPPDGLEVTGIQFFKDGQQITSPETPQIIFSHIISSSSQDNVGNYSCGFWVNHVGRQILSQRSLAAVVNIVGALETPILMLVPNYKLYVTGETLQILCVADSTAAYINIHKNGQLLMKSTFPEKIFRYSVPSLNHGANGNYTCTYHRNIQARMLESVTSQSHYVHVIDPPLAPNLTMGYSVEKVNDGFQVTLNCSAPDFDLMRTFYIIKTSDKHCERNVTDYIASLTWELGHVSHVTFYCEYEEEIQERKIRSRRSQTLTIPLAGPSLLSPPMVAGIIGVVSLVLCLVLILLFYMKYKRKYKDRQFNFSLYWKTPKKVSKQHIPNHPKSKEQEVNPDQENLRQVSRNPTRLSIATAKEDDAEDIAMNFFTFQRQPGERRNLPAADFQHQPGACEELEPPKCVWNDSYL